jgi:hypothetical protein
MSSHKSIAFIAQSRYNNHINITEIKKLRSSIWNNYGLNQFRPRLETCQASEFYLHQDYTVKEFLENRIHRLYEDNHVFYLSDGSEFVRATNPTTSHLIMNGKSYDAMTRLVYWKTQSGDICIKVTLAKIFRGDREIFHMQSSSHQTKIPNLATGNAFQCDQCGLLRTTTGMAN